MKLRKRALSSTPAMPMTRSGGKPLASSATWHMASRGFVTTIRMAFRRVRHGLADDGADDARVLGHQVVAAHARLAGQAAGHHDHVRAGRLRVVVGAADLHVVPDHRRRLGEVERLALRQPLHDVDQHHVRQPGLGDALRGRRADVAGADDGDEGVGHRWQGSFRGQRWGRVSRSILSAGRRLLFPPPLFFSPGPTQNPPGGVGGCGRDKGGREKTPEGVGGWGGRHAKPKNPKGQAPSWGINQKQRSA